MRRADLHQTVPVARGKGQLREGLRYVWRTPGCASPLLLVAVVGTLAYNFQVVLALFARSPSTAGPGVYRLLTSLMGGGAVVGGLLIATRNRPNIHRLTAIGMVFGAPHRGRGPVARSGHRPG